MKNRNKPWLDKNGNPLPDDKLREIQKSWGGSTWEAYLADQVDVQMKEVLMGKPTDINKYSDEDHESFLENLKTSFFPNLEAHMEGAMRRLTRKEQQVLRALYWRNLSLRKAASELGLAVGTVRSYRDRALKKLHEEIGKPFN